MKKILTILCIFFLLITLISPSTCTTGMKNGIQICLYTLLPSFFPFLVITNLLIRYDLHKYISTLIHPIFSKIFNVSKNGSFVVLTGFTCGYPIGIKTAGDMYNCGNISYAEYLHLIKFCNNPSLPFVVNYVAYSILTNNYSVWKLLISVYGASIMTGMLFGRNKTTKYPECHIKNNISSSNNIFIQAFYTIANLSAYVLLFSIGIAYIQILLPHNSIFKTLLITLTEITSGFHYLSEYSNVVDYVPLIIVSLVSGGLSITAQSLSLLKSTTEIKSYLTGKSVSILVSVLIYIVI